MRHWLCVYFSLLVMGPDYGRGHINVIGPVLNDCRGPDMKCAQDPFDELTAFEKKKTICHDIHRDTVG